MTARTATERAHLRWSRKRVPEPDLTEAINRLPPRARMALMLCHEGKTYDQIARLIKVEPDVARRLVEKALEYLVELFGAPP